MSLKELRDRFQHFGDWVIFMYLLSEADECGEVHKSIREIAKETGNSYSCVWRFIKRYCESKMNHLLNHSEGVITICDIGSYDQLVLAYESLSESKVNRFKEQEKDEEKKEPKESSKENKESKEEDKEEERDRNNSDELFMSTPKVVDVSANNTHTREKLTKGTKEKVDFDYNAFGNWFNEKVCAKGCRIPRITKITKDRISWINARLEEYDYSKETLALVVEKSVVSKFLNGDNNTGFIADFNWIFRPRNFTKILEGNYDNR